MGWAAGNYEERAVMNLQTWAKWVTEINELLGGAEVKLSPGPFGGMIIGVRWMVGKELMGYEHAMSLVEMERMYEVVQPCVLEQITINAAINIRDAGMAILAGAELLRQHEKSTAGLAES